MSYQVLARKWRPSNFSEVAGQGHVLKSLINALDNQRLHHAYLFTGTRGVGKTTLARILAKCLNCERGISSTPCESCAACTEINQGRFIDLLEVDAASRTKVEDTRELLDNVQYTPTRGRFKVYLIDEVHMLSNHSFNALLKTLEEPPPHVKFLLATTDPQKLPVTILSRCLQFNLKNLSPGVIVTYLTQVLEQEQISAEEEALWQIAASAAGSMRDALTLVDQAIAYCQGEITAEGTVEMLGIPERRQVYDLLSAMAEGDAPRLLSVINIMDERTPDYAQTLDSLLSLLHRIALAQVVPDAIDNSFGDRELVRQLAGRLSAEDVQLYYQIGGKGKDELRVASDLRGAFEMIVLRMLVFSPDYSAQTNASGVPNEAQKSTTPGSDAAPEEKKKTLTEVEVQDSARSVLDQLDQSDWLEVVPQLGAQGIIANILANTEIIRARSGCIELRLDSDQSAAFNDDLVPRITAVLGAFFGEPVDVKIAIAPVSCETPALRGRRLRSEAEQRLIAEFEQDTQVQELLTRFSGTVARESIEPLDDAQ